MSKVEREFARLQRVFKQIGRPLKLAPPAPEERIAAIEQITGINPDESLKDLWRISNGSAQRNWFADGAELGDADFLPLQFMSIRDGLSFWQHFLPYDEKTYADWYDDESWGKRDPRIQRHFLRHRKWLPFAEFNGGSELLQLDYDPTPAGQAGQVIKFSHDPDAIFWKQASFLEFFQRSNDLLESCLEYPEDLLENMKTLERYDCTTPAALTSPNGRGFQVFDLQGIRVEWPLADQASARWSSVVGKSPNPLENKYRIVDDPYALSIDRGNLTFDDDGVECDFGCVEPGDCVRVAGVRELEVNGVPRPGSYLL